ncbi:MAG TPA: RHS repeat-associated core domain-containing protein [Armatimonadota bacterium]
MKNSTLNEIANPLRYRAMKGYQCVYDIPGTSTNGQHTFYTAGARTYDAGTGRWLQEDPIVGITGDPMSFNRYLYCDANPVMNDDPTGLALMRHGRPCHAPKWYAIDGVLYDYVFWIGVTGPDSGGFLAFVGGGLASAEATSWLYPDEEGQTDADRDWCRLLDKKDRILKWFDDANAGVGHAIDDILKSGGTYSGYGTA